MNSVVHFEIPASDPGKAKEFYTKVFGWMINEIPGANYWMAYTTETDMKTQTPTGLGINGGIVLKKDAAVADKPIVYVDVKDIDESLKTIEAAGGKTVEPKTAMGEWGHYAIVADPEGNVIGLYQK